MATYYSDSTTQDLDKLLSMSKATRARLEPAWLLNLAYFNGQQWVMWNRGRLDKPVLAPHRVTLTDNRIIGIVRTELAKMTKQKPAWQVTPTTPQEEDLQAALMGEKVLDYLWRHLQMRRRLEEALLWSRICGAGFWKVVWDSAKGQKVRIVSDQEGQPVMHAETGAPMKPEHFEGQMPEGLLEKTIATGDVTVETVSPFEMYVDPIPTELADCEWCIQVAVKSPEYVAQHFDVEIAPDTEVSTGAMEARMFPTGQDTGSSQYKGVKVHEYWCKPNSTHPEGRRAVWCKDRMLFEGANPYKSLPYVLFMGIPVPGRFWGTSIVQVLRGPQTQLNKTISQITENAERIGNPAILISRQSGAEYSGVPGERIDFDDTVPNAKPEYLPPPNMPQYVLQQLDRIQQSMQEISGQHEVSNAQVPAGVKAASAINLLQEADDTRLGPAIYDMEETLAKAGEMLLKLVAQYWTDERTILIAGKDHALDAMVFRGAALGENTQVEVQAGSAFPKSKAAKQAAIQDMLNLYFQYQGQQPMNKRMIAKVLEDMEAGALAKLFGDTSKDESQINRENQQIAEGTPLRINAFDNHQAHVEGHEEFQKGPTYMQLGPQIAQLMEQHVKEHREQVMRELPPPEQMQLPGTAQSNGKPAQPQPSGQR